MWGEKRRRSEFNNPSDPLFSWLKLCARFFSVIHFTSHTLALYTVGHTTHTHTHGDEGKIVPHPKHIRVERW